MRHGRLIAVCVSSLLTVAACEALLSATDSYDDDPRLGWRLKSNLSKSRDGTDPDGRVYRIEYATDRNGFRHFGDLDSGRPRLLCIGDSWTAQRSVSNSDAWFAKLAELLDVEVFAIGGEGYGTLQELLLFEEVRTLVEPDAVLLQFCNNDFVDNSLEAENWTPARIQKNRRPYLVGDEVAPRLPAHHPWRILARFHLFSVVDTEIARWQMRRLAGQAPPGWDRHQTLEAFRGTDEYEKTDRLFAMFRDAVPAGVPLYSFNVNAGTEAELAAWEEIARRNGLAVIPDVGKLVDDEDREGATVYTVDLHWSIRGHELAARQLARGLSADWASPGRATSRGASVAKPDGAF